MNRQTKAAVAALLGAVVGIATLAAVVLWLRDADGGTSAGDATVIETGPVETGATGELPETTSPEERTTTIEVGGFPNALAVARGSVWVVRDGRQLVQIDAETAEVAARVGASDDLGSERPCGIAATRDALWVATVSGNLSRISLRTGRFSRLIDLDEAACVATGAGSVWVTSPTLGRVTRIDPVTGEVTAEIDVGGFPQGIAVGFRSVWVATSVPEETQGTIVRIDPATGEVRRELILDAVSEFLAVGAGRVWVTADDGTIQAIDPREGALLDEPVRIAESGRTTLAVGGGFVWAAVMTGPDAEGTVAQIDPETLEVIGDPIPVGEAPVGMTFGAGALWVANYDDGTVTRYEP